MLTCWSHAKMVIISCAGKIQFLFLPVLSVLQIVSFIVFGRTCYLGSDFLYIIDWPGHFCV